MGIDFGALPPEINSARIYAGPGSASFMTAASAWNGVAAELNSAALGYDNIVTTLASEEWLGPASAAMASAVQPYVAWMTTTAGQAEQAAVLAQSAAAAYETALASVVPPPLIAANRAELAQATATNVLGQNNGVIAQLESQYAEFWAQSAAAMYNYAGQAAAAAKVTPFTNSPAIANPAASATQAAAASASPAQSLQGFLSKVQTALSELQTPAGTNKLVTAIGSSNPWLTQLYFLLTGSTTLPSNLSALVSAYSPYASFFYNTEGLPYFSVGMGNFGTQISKSAGWLGGAATAAPAAVPKGLPGLGGLLGGGAGAAAHATGALGGAGSIGKLSVPVSWSGAAPAAAAAHAVPVSSISAAPEAAAGGPGNLLGGMPLAGVGSGGAGGAGPRYGFRPTVMARPPLGG
jgi:PPE-repeat protein